MIPKKKKLLILAPLLTLVIFGSTFLILQNSEKQDSVNPYTITKNVMIYGTSHSYCNYLHNSPSLLLENEIITVNSAQILFNVTNLSEGSAIPINFIQEILLFHNLSDYDYVILELTTSAYGIELIDFENQMKYIIENIIGNHSIPILQTSVFVDYPTHFPSRRNDYILPYNEIFYNLSTEYEIPLVDVLSRFRNEIENGNWDLFIRNTQYPETNILYFQNTHPNQKGQFYIFQEINNVLLKSIQNTQNLQIQDRFFFKSSNFTLPNSDRKILINGNLGWDLFLGTILSQGEGTRQSPYIFNSTYLEAKRITFLEIVNSSWYFQIENYSFIQNENYFSTLKLTNVTHGRIINTQFQSFRTGLVLISCSDILIENCNFTRCEEIGLDILNSNAIDVKRNWFESNSFGINTYFSSQINISFNMFYKNEVEGISMIHSIRIFVEKNEFFHNHINQINIYESEEILCNHNYLLQGNYGIVVGNVNNSVFECNLIENHSNFAIRIWRWSKISQNNNFSQNIFLINYLGLKFEGIYTKNHVLLNYFINNTQSISCFSKSIDFSLENRGNYYSEQNAKDENRDGISDKAYCINLNQGIYDYFPLYLTKDQLLCELKNLYSHFS